MVIKMDTMGAAHAANAINYVLDKEKARKEDKPVFLVSNNIELNPLTGKPFSPVDVLMDMQLRQASSRHRVEEPFWRIELCPPAEVCRRWTMPQWEKFCKDCVEVLDTTGSRPTMLADSQYIATVHFDTGKFHVHIVANRITMDDQVQDTHRFKERAREAANIIADRYGWMRAEERDNQRMKRIHDTALSVLRAMPRWDIETYFAGMRSNGFEVEPTYDRQGICRGYSIGEKLYDLDGNYSSTVMYKASAKKFGHGRDLTVSKLYGTWLREHPEMERAVDDSRRWHRHKPQKTVMPHNAPKPSKTNDDDEYQRLLKAKKENKEPTRGERERENAIWDAVKAVREFVKSPFRESFHLREQEDTLPEGIVAKAIDMEQEAGLSRDPDNRQAAAFYDPKEYERRVKVVVEGKMLEGVVRDAIGLLTEQAGLLNDIPLDVMRNNNNKLVNQDMDIQPLEDMNRKAGETLRSVVRCIHDSRFMGIYLEELTRGDRERWQLSEKDKAALFTLPVLAYYTGKYHLNDTMTFLWLVAGMPLLAITTVWGVNEVVGWIARRKAKPLR